MMTFINNEFEYRNWIIEEIFQVSAVSEASEFADQEVDDFIFDARPVSYPCIAVDDPNAGPAGGLRASLRL
ncbi:hypothetical protein ACVWVR_004105 [Ewingella americana]